MPRALLALTSVLTRRAPVMALIGLALAALLAPPFSGLDTLPSLGAVFIALAIILEDVVALAIGLAVGAGGVVLIVTVGATLLHLVRGLF